MKALYYFLLTTIIFSLFGCSTTQSGSTSTADEGVLKLSGFITQTPDPKETPLIIRVTKSSDVEEIRIINISTSPIDISGYLLFSEILEDRLILPEQTILESQDVLSVYNGKKPINGAIHWNDDFSILNIEDQILLLNRAGRIIYYYTYYP